LQKDEKALMVAYMKNVPIYWSESLVLNQTTIAEVKQTEVVL
jgi:hypothetical protein